MDLSARSIMHLMLQATWARCCNLRGSCQTDGREKRHKSVNYGGSSGIDGRCCSCWRVIGIASGHGMGQQMLSTYYSYKPSSYQARTTSPPTLAMPINLQELQLRLFYLPKHHHDEECTANATTNCSRATKLP